MDSIKSKENKKNACVVKLAFATPGDEAGPFRRIALNKFIGSHQKLCEAAAALAAVQDEAATARLVQYKLRLTYVDEEGDACLLLDDQDLKVAFGTEKKPLKVYCQVLELGVVTPAVAAGTTPTRASTPVSTPTEAIPEASPDRSRPPTLNQTVESVVDALANAVLAFQATSFSVDTATSATTADPPAARAPEDHAFIHGRHTCDGCLTTPIVGQRFHAMNMADYDLCAKCKENYKGEDIAFEAAELDRDRPMQERWHRRHAKWGPAGRAQWRGRRGCGPPHHGPPHHGPPHHGPPHHGPPHHGPPHHGPPHHGPRGLRGRGPRHFGPPPPYPPAPYPPAVPCGPPLQQTEIDAALKIDHVHASPPCQVFAAKAPSGPPPQQTEIEAAVAALKEVSHVDHVFVSPPCHSYSDIDTALKEAIRRSMEDVKEVASQTENKDTSTEAVQTEAPPCSSVVNDEPAIIVEATTKSAPPKSESSVKSTPSQSSQSKATQSGDSFASDAAGNGEVAAVLGETMDKIAFAIEEMNVELERSTSDAEVDNDSDEDSDSDKESEIVPETVEDEKIGAVIVDGEANDEDACSQNSWSVVEDQVAHDESLARAAQVIGSALFNSGMSDNNGNFQTNEVSIASIDSVPTHVPSIGSDAPLPMAYAPLPMALTDRWVLQLHQMHELGFMNDCLTIETLERLNAANIGSDETEEISVQRVVNEMMKDW